MSRLVVESPIGPFALIEEDEAIVAIDWGGTSAGAPTRLLVEAKRQLGAYFTGKRQRFDLPVQPRGATADVKVWRAMADIPFGRTKTYGEIAKMLELTPLFVGQACGRNPVPILLPCHRVVSAAGLGGFSAPGGVEWKRRLLLHEGALLL
jgi:methylated-DNA-[protein]-cysteine S-methyltransferase